MPLFPSITTDGAFESAAVRAAIKALAAEAASEVTLYDSGPRDITALSPTLTSGTIRLHVKNGWAQIAFLNVVFPSSSPTVFPASGPIQPYSPKPGASAIGTVNYTDNAKNVRVLTSSSGATVIYDLPANTAATGTIMWALVKEPPAVAPGTPL